MRPMHQPAKPRLIQQLFGSLWVVATIAAVYLLILGIFFNGEWAYFVAAFTLAVVMKALATKALVSNALVSNALAAKTLVGEAGALGLDKALSVDKLSAEQLNAEKLNVGQQSAGERSGEAPSAKEPGAKEPGAKELGAEGLGVREPSGLATERIVGSAQEIAVAFENCTFNLDIEPKDAQLRHMASALAGSQTAAPPAGYVAALFDGYAGYFETELVDTLAYRTPTTLASMMRAHSVDKTLGRGLDLGCGTGLAGVALKNHSGPIVGVDVSKAMLKQAHDKGIYEALVHQDMVEFLTATELAFDYFVALDAFPYVGDLTPILSLIKSRNTRNATLAFSTEHRQSGRYFLEKTGRYTHSKAYIETLCEQLGYRMVHFETCQLRKEEDVFLTGGLYLLAF